MSSFAELMKVAQQNTQLSNREAMEAAQRREDALRQAREEQAKKERAEKEIQKQIQLRRAEDAKRDEERKKQREQELARKREELAKKKQVEAEQAKYTAAGSSRDGTKKKSSPSPYIVVNSSAMTREEKRMAKDPLMADVLKARRQQAVPKKRKDGRLPGGAIAAESSTSPSKATSGSHLSARARIAGGFAPTLTRLNTEKRDTRTIDEITRDLRKGRISGSERESAGEKSQTFEFFSSKDKPKLPGTADNKKKPLVSGRDPPKSNAATTSRPLQGSRPYPSSSAAAGSSSSLKLSTKPGASSAAATNRTQKPLISAASRKRPRDETDSDEDSFLEDDEDEDSEEERRYAKRSGGLGESQRNMIWQLMGKDRSRYAGVSVDSDEEMEVTREELEREERQSARIAKKEDAEAEAELKRQEMEKKRKKAALAAARNG